MSQQEFDAVIRRADPQVQADPDCQVLVTLDTRTGKTIRPNLWRLGKSAWAYFLVTNIRKVEAVAVRRGLKIGIEDFSRDWHFDLFLDYEAKCSPGRETRVAEALWNGPSPQEKLESLLKGWVLRSIEGRAAEFVRDFDRSAGDLAGDLRARALEQTGLTLAVRVLLAEADRLDPWRIGPLSLPLRVRDRDDEIDLRFEAELMVDVGKERLAFLHRDRQAPLTRDVQRRVREHFTTGVTLQQFHAELHGSVQAELWRCLDEVVEPYGRRLVRLSLGGEAYPGVDESKRVAHKFSHRLRDYPEPVEVQTELLLQLADLGRYVRAKAPNLQDWAAHEVESVAVQLLFGVTYTDLCIGYEQKKFDIEQRMRERAAAIGYELKQLITITDLQFDLLRRPFLVQLAGEFSTRLATLKVRLEVNATLVVPHPSELAPLLDRRMDVKAQIQASLGDRIQQKLHEVDPEQFYMEFEVAKEGRTPVRDQLESVIRETVKRDFFAEVLSLSCKQLETDLSQRLQRLMAPLHLFSVKVVPSHGGPPVLFDGSFRVTGVDESGWIAFQTSDLEPEMLSSRAARHLRHKLADESLGQLLQVSNAEQKARVSEWIQERILAEFGLLILVMDWLRSPLNEERLAASARLALAADTVEDQKERILVTQQIRARTTAMRIRAAESRLEQLGELQDRLRRVLVTGDSPEVEKELRERIARLEAEQKAELREVQGERSHAILPELQVARGILTDGAEKAPSEEAEAREGVNPTGADSVRA